MVLVMVLAPSSQKEALGLGFGQMTLRITYKRKRGFEEKDVERSEYGVSKKLSMCNRAVRELVLTQ